MERSTILKSIRDAIKCGDVSEVRRLIGLQPDLLEETTVFGTWLHAAASAGNLEIVRQLNQLGLDLNKRGGVSGGTAINEAAEEGHLAVVEYLLDHGAELSVDEPERNPLFAAIHGGHTAVAKLLIDRGIDTTIKYTGDSMKEMDALAYAREWGRKDIAALLCPKTQSCSQGSNDH